MGFRRVRLVLTAATLGAILVTGAASAEPTAADRETARSLMTEGRELREKGHVQDALKRFKAADDIMRVPTTGLELARTQATMGLLLEARDTIANIRKLPSSASDPEPFKDARAKAEELDNTLEARIPALTIVVQGAAAGETPTIVVDGSQLAAAVTGLPRRVNAGRHTVVVKTPTSQGEQTVDVKEGEQKEVQVRVSASSKTPDTTPPEGEATQAQAEHTSESSGPTSHSPTVLTWVGISVGGAGLIAGAVTGLLSMSKTSSLKNECTKDVCTSSQARSDYNSAGTLATISDIGFALAGAGAALAVTTLLLGHDASNAPATQSTPTEGQSPSGPDSPVSQSRLRIVPWIGLGSAGVVGVF
jgi:hypothetical protein